MAARPSTESEPRGIGPDRITAVVIGTRGPDEIWVGTEPSRIYWSTDAGETWTEKSGLTDLPSASEWSFPPRPHTHHVRWIEPDPYDPEHLYVGIEAGALVQTHDSGVSWAKPQDGLEHRYCWSVAVDPADPDCILLSAASGSRPAHSPAAAESYVYRRRNAKRWRRLDGPGLPMGEGVVRAELAAGATGGTFYAATNNDLYRTADQDDSWTAVDSTWDDALTTQTPQGLAVVSDTVGA